MEKHGFVYIWYDRKRKMYYIGCHWGNENDGYICSSKRMRNNYAYRKEDFKRRILITNIPSKKETFEEEFKWLQLISKKELGRKYYNQTNHFKDHWSTIKDISGKNHPMYGKHHTEETKKRMSEMKIGYIPWNKGKTGIYSDEMLKAMGAKNKGKSNRRGQFHTEEAKRKMSEANKGQVAWNIGKKMKWITNHFITKQIPIECEIPGGWVKGRK